MIYELNHYVPTIISQGHVVLMCFFFLFKSLKYGTRREKTWYFRMRITKRRPACASAQTGQHLCYSLSEKTPATLALSKMSIVLPVSIIIAEKIGPSLTWSGTPKLFFPASRPLFKNDPERTCLKVIFNGTVLSSVWNGSSWRQGYKFLRHAANRPPDKSAYGKLFFLFLSQNICCGYSKEPSHCDGSCEHPKHMFKLMDKQIMTIFRWNALCCQHIKPIAVVK